MKTEAKKEGYFFRGWYNNPEFKCFHCKKVTVLEDLKKITGRCECGNKISYLTNIKDSLFDIECRNCGSPVTFEWNKKTYCFTNV